MKKLQANEDGWYCGWWNDSPIQINFAERQTRYRNEALHYHRDFYEYYLVVDGELTLEVEGTRHQLTRDEMIVVEPMEHHQVVELSAGCKYVSVKSQSYEGNKVRVASAGDTATSPRRSKVSRVARSRGSAVPESK